MHRIQGLAFINAPKKITNCYQSLAWSGIISVTTVQIAIDMEINLPRLLSALFSKVEGSKVIEQSRFSISLECTLWIKR